MSNAIRCWLSAFSVWVVCVLPGAAAEPATAKLPLDRVVLYSSGVGFFQHSGEIVGDAQIELRFNSKDINDLLKSMVVQDSGGRVSAVSYGSKDPLTRTLKTFTVDLTDDPTLADLLQQVRGEKVELMAPQRIEGIVVGVEKRKRELGKDQTIEFDVLNLLADDGLRSIPLETASRIKLANPQLDAELRKALAVLAAGHDSEKKTVTLRFLGQGKRQAMVAYIQETPVWKTSYRLVLSDDKAPFLQGWAIVENTTDEDWTGVNLALVSGRPISFTMDLYQPLYAPRPEEKLQLFSSLRPQVYQQDLSPRKMKEEMLAEEQAAVPAAPPAREYARRGAEAASAGVAVQRLRIAQGVPAAARGGDVGELFQYAIATPVTIARQQSAMLPIVGEAIKAERLSIFNARVQEKHPLNGLKLVNSTTLHLMQGPITVFDGDTYAGDAMIQDIAPGAERLVSYALDLETEVAAQSKGRPEQLQSVALARGTAIVTRKLARSVEYTIRNSGAKAKKVLIEQPLEIDWNLVRPEKPAEKTRDQYRFLVEAKPGEPGALTVEEERIERQFVAIANLDDQAIGLYLSAPAVSEAVKKALTEIGRRKGELAEAERKLAELERQVREITAEQTRIRQNMERLDRTGELYQRYVKKFSDQEDQVEKIGPQAGQLRDEIAKLRKGLEEYLLGLDLQG